MNATQLCWAEKPKGAFRQKVERSFGGRWNAHSEQDVWRLFRPTSHVYVRSA